MRRSIDQAPTVILWPIRTELKYEKGQLGAAPIWLWAPASARHSDVPSGQTARTSQQNGSSARAADTTASALIARGGCRAQWMALLLNTDGDLTWC
jgi:hypothetical protein